MVELKLPVEPTLYIIVPVPEPAEHNLFPEPYTTFALTGIVLTLPVALTTVIVLLAVLVTPPSVKLALIVAITQ